jgi:hypothetical protein
MQRVTKQMATIKPEIDALQKRYKDDPKKLQEETMRLYRERGATEGTPEARLLIARVQASWMVISASKAFSKVTRNFTSWCRRQGMPRWNLCICRRLCSRYS